MFRSIVVPVDRSPASDRAVALAVALARRAALPIRLVSVCDPSDDRVAVEADLHARAQRAFPVPCTSTVLVDPAVKAPLLSALAQRPDSLVIMGTRARHAAELLLGSVTESLLARTDRPLLLAGPHVDTSRLPSPSNLVVAVDSPGTADVLAPAVVEWTRCFASQPWMVEVVEPAAIPAGRQDDITETGLVHRAAALLEGTGIDAEWDVLHGHDRVDALISFTESRGGGVIAVATHRWADPAHVHWSSTARSLVHRSPFPVLVLPVHT